MTLKRGLWVFYQGDLYTVEFDYGNGFAEVRKVNTYHVELVKVTDLIVVKELNKEIYEDAE